MTFKTFEKIVAAERPDVRVSKHGDYCTGKSNYTLGVIYINPETGKESRVYDYSGTYIQVLGKLGITCVAEKSRIKAYEQVVARYNRPDDVEKLNALKSAKYIV